MLHARPVFIPTLYYVDPVAAIRWLEQAFGFELDALVTDQQGRVGHSEMSYRGAVLSIHSEFSSEALLGPAEFKSPASLSAGNSQMVRVNLEAGIDAHCEQARAAGARITQEPADQFYGERIYRALDPEGHVWVFAESVADLSFEQMEQATGLKFSTTLEDAKLWSNAKFPSVSSAVCYRDPIAALTWLEQAFGFEQTLVILMPDGGLAHSQMSFGDGMIMVGNEWSSDHASPASIGGKNTQTVHIQLEADIDSHCERARAAGAKILQEPETQFYGDRTYRARDPEGHIWTFGQTVEVMADGAWDKDMGTTTPDPPLMDAEAFLALALSLPETALASHLRNRDVRVRGKIFAGPADGAGGTAVIKLTAEQQEMMCGSEPDLFRPEDGYWGRVGWTRMVVVAADEDTARSALWTAWRNVAPPSLAKLHSRRDGEGAPHKSAQS